MDLQSLATLIALVLLPLLYFNVSRTRDILLWERSLSSQAILISLVWLLPFLGAIVAYKKLNLGFINKQLKNKSDPNAVAGDVLLGIESMFNPAQENVKEAKKEVIVEQRQDDDIDKSSLNKN